MPMLIDSVEDRLRYYIGDLVLQNELLKQQLDDANRKIADLEAQVDQGENSDA